MPVASLIAPMCTMPVRQTVRKTEGNANTKEVTMEMEHRLVKLCCQIKGHVAIHIAIQIIRYMCVTRLHYQPSKLL